MHAISAFLHACIHTCMHVNIHTNIPAYIYAYTYIHNTNIHTCMPICMHTCMHLYMHANICARSHFWGGKGGTPQSMIEQIIEHRCLSMCSIILYVSPPPDFPKQFLKQKKHMRCRANKFRNKTNTSKKKRPHRKTKIKNTLIIRTKKKTREKHLIFFEKNTTK